MSITNTGPFFMVDFGRGLRTPEWDALTRGPNVVGAILKVSQGLVYDTRWFREQWSRARAAGGARYGSTWFRGAYHFATPGDGSPAHGAAQADYALDTIDAAGGWGDGDIPLAWDIEGDAWNDDKALRRRVSMGFAERVYRRTGRQPWLYANGDIGIGADDGFSIMWTPHPKRLAPWPVSKFGLYQYAGLNDGRVSYYDPSGIPAQRGFPLRIDGWGSSHGTDMNVVIGRDGRALTSAAELAPRLTGNTLGFWRRIAFALGFVAGARAVSK